MSRVHEGLLGDGPPAAELRHTRPPAWAGTPLDGFLRDAGERFGDRLTLVGFHSPYKRYHIKLFHVLTPQTSFDDFFDFVTFARPYQASLRAEKVFLNTTTPALLTSQFYTLWGHVALEAHILRAQAVYAPRGGFSLRLPEARWTLQKIRESVAVFEEFYLPFLTSPLAKGEGMDFCKIYERAETEMLFHYYCYLQDREAYLEVLQRSGGDTDGVIAYGCARYGSEIGIHDWHPIRFIDSYPYLKAMLRQVDDMALRQLEKLRQPVVHRQPGLFSQRAGDRAFLPQRLGLSERDGVLVADEPRAMAAAIVRLLQDDPYRETMARAALEACRARFSWDRLLHQAMPDILGITARQGLRSSP